MLSFELNILSQNQWGIVRSTTSDNQIELRFKSYRYDLSEVELVCLIDALEHYEGHTWFNTYLGLRVLVNPNTLNIDFVLTSHERKGLLSLLIEAYLIFEAKRIIKHKSVNN